MDILWLSHNVPFPPIGGVLQRNYNLIKEVAGRHNIHLIAFNQRSLLSTENDLAEARRALEKLGVRADILPIPCDASKLSWYGLAFRSFVTKLPYTVNWLKSVRMHQNLQQTLQRQKKAFDIVHYDTIGLAQYCMDTGGAPKILNHHNIESAMMQRRARRERNVFRKLYFLIEALKLAKYENLMCPVFDANLTVSYPDKSLLARMIRYGRIEVVPNGVDLDYFRPQSARIKKNSLIFAGSLDWYPNRDGILFFLREIWPFLKREIANCQLTIAGKNPPAQVLGIARREPRISVTGFVEDLRGYIDEAEVYVCPIRDGGGTRLKILDAMAMGKAIVSTSIACEGIDVTPEKDILIADTPMEFVTQIKKICANKVLRNDLGTQARHLVEGKYSWKIIGGELCRLYESFA